MGAEVQQIFDFALTVLGMLGSAGAAVLAFGRFALRQLLSQMDARFETMEQSRSEATKHWDNRFSSIEHGNAETAKDTQRVERELLMLKAELPQQFVRRDDFIVVQSRLESKLDAMGNRLERLGNTIMRKN